MARKILVHVQHEDALDNVSAPFSSQDVTAGIKLPVARVQALAMLTWSGTFGVTSQQE